MEPADVYAPASVPVPRSAREVDLLIVGIRQRLVEHCDADLAGALLQLITHMFTYERLTGVPQCAIRRIWATLATGVAANSTRARIAQVHDASWHPRTREERERDHQLAWAIVRACATLGFFRCDAFRALFTTSSFATPSDDDARHIKHALDTATLAFATLRARIPWASYRELERAQWQRASIAISTEILREAQRTYDAIIAAVPVAAEAALQRHDARSCAAAPCA